MSEMKSLTLNDKTYDGFVDPVARSLAAASAVIKSASGESITLSDTSDSNVYGLTIYGKTTQAGTPTPDAPVELVSVGNSGGIGVMVAGENETQGMTVATPNGLPGIPVTSGGNYTDANGQQWICDEIDLARGVYVQRIAVKVFTGKESYVDYIAGAGGVTLTVLHLDKTPLICSHLVPGKPTVGWANSGAIVFAVAAVGCATMDEFVAFVTEQYSKGTPIAIAYVLPAPIETPLSEEEISAYASLHTYRDHTTVSNDAGAYMELEYVMDAKKYIDSLVAGGSILPATVE